MNQRKTLKKIRERRKNRRRAKIFGTAERPRLSVFRSGRSEYLQLIDDYSGKTVVSATVHELSLKNGSKRVERAEKLGELLAKKAAAKGIKKAVADIGRYRYHGRIKAIVEGARKGGLIL